MAQLNQEQFDANVRMLTLVVLDACDRRQIEPDDAAGVIGAGLAQGLVHYLGALGAVERLRDLADIIERDVLAEIVLQ